MDTNEQDRLQKLIFATSNIPWLRGLTMIPGGLWMIWSRTLAPLAKSDPWIAFAELLAVTAAAIYATWRVNKFYDTHYGRVNIRQRYGFPLTGLAVWVLIFFGTCLGGPHGTPAVALWIAAFFWGIYMTSSGYRWYYLLLTIVFAALAPRWVSLGEWQLAAVGAAFVCAGVTDHLLLRRLMPLRHQEEAPSVV